MTPVPKAMACLKAAAYSMLLPRRRVTYTLLMVSHMASEAPVGVRRTMRGACKGRKAQSGHFPLSFSAHNRPYLMAMAAATYKQGIIFERLWAARLLLRPEESKEAVFLKKRPKRAKIRSIRGKKREREESDPTFFFRENGLSSGY